MTTQVKVFIASLSSHENLRLTRWCSWENQDPCGGCRFAGIDIDIRSHKFVVCHLTSAHQFTTSETSRQLTLWRFLSLSLERSSLLSLSLDIRPVLDRERQVTWDTLKPQSPFYDPRIPVLTQLWILMEAAERRQPLKGQPSDGVAQVGAPGTTNLRCLRNSPGGTLVGHTVAP